jgi:hypothetical protein
MERPLAAGETLAKDLGIFVDENGHRRFPGCTRPLVRQIAVAIKIINIAHAAPRDDGA